MSRQDDVLGFWFGAAATTPEEMQAKLKRWYRGGEDVDRVIGAEFAYDVERALEGKLDDWAANPHGRVALVILLDQFPRNLFRGEARAFAGDAAAQKLARDAFDRHVDRDLARDERMFLIMPLVHAENLVLQEQAIGLMDRVVADAPVELRGVYSTAMESTRWHRDQIAKFGRFPGRNAALGRESTPEEQAFLATRSAP